MTKRFGRTLLVAGLAAFGLAEAASATLYVSRRYCGGDKFATCAAVQVDVTGTFVTIRVWNLSGNTAGSWGTNTSALTAFNGLGLYNVPPSVDAITSTLTTSGPAKPFNSAPAPWVLSNNKSVAFLLDFAAVPPTQGATGFRNTIASGCAPINQLPNDRMFMNPCIDPSNGTQADWMTFRFQVTQTFDASNVGIVIRGKDVTTGLSTECWTDTSPSGLAPTCHTVTPEPLTMTLLATGLVAMGGVGYLRRRKKQLEA